MHIEVFYNNRFGFDKYYAREVIFWNSPMVANLPIWAKEPKPPYPHTHKPKDRAELVAILSKKYEVNGEFYEVPLSAIDTSAIIDMSFLFANYKNCDFFLTLLKDSRAVENCESSIKNREDFEGIENWDTSNVVDMKYMFYGSERFNHSIQSWNVSQVKNMRSMFEGAKNFNQPLDKWDTSSVKDMSSMFSGAESFNQHLNTWQVGNVYDMRSMFERATKFNQPLDKWNVSNVYKINYMFVEASSFKKDLNMWNILELEGIPSYVFEGSPLQSNPPKWYKNLVGQKRE